MQHSTQAREVYNISRTKTILIASTTLEKVKVVKYKEKSLPEPFTST